MTERKLGQVKWDFQSGGYKGGLDQIYKTHKSGTPNFIPIHTLCREVAIAKVGPEGVLRNFIKIGEQFVAQGILTLDELNYIYTQFEFDPATYVLPEHVQQES